MNSPFGFYKAQCSCIKNRCIYWPPYHVYTGKYLLGDKNQFCSTFFHTMPIWELGVTKHVCLRQIQNPSLHPKQCLRKIVSVIVRVEKNNKTLKALRYTGCITKDRRPIHAEEFLVSDDLLLIPGSSITLYDQLQPCNHSGGKDGEYDSRSCTEIVIKWYNEKLKPLNITLSIQCGSIYKAMWDDDITKFDKSESFDFKTSSQNAREGIIKIKEAGIHMTMITKDGWKFLMSVTKPSSSHQGLSKCSPLNITEKMWNDKHIIHAKMNSFLDKLSRDDL